MTRYRLVIAETPSKLSTEVEFYIRDGWRPQGGVSFDSNRKEFIQAMVKG